jgi:hypothetical protein
MRERVELLAYVRAIPLLVLNPILLLAPLLVSILDQVLSEAFPNSADGIVGGGFASFLIFLLDTFGLAIAVLAADMIWRRGKTSFDEAWDEAKRKAGDILLAAIGLNFIIFVARYAGDTISPIAGVAFMIAAMVCMVYTIPAAALSGVPGSAALQKSLDIVRAAPINAIILSVIAILAYFFIGIYVPYRFFIGLGTITLVVAALFKSIALSYIAMIMAERYNALGFSNRF